MTLCWGGKGQQVRTRPAGRRPAAPGQAGGCAGCTPSLTIFSAAVLLMKRDPCPGLPMHFTFIPAAVGGEGDVEKKAQGSTGAPTPGRARDGAVGTQLLTPWALLAVEDAERVRWAGQACSGHTWGSAGHRGAMMSPPLLCPGSISPPGWHCVGHCLGERVPRRVPGSHARCRCLGVDANRQRGACQEETRPCASHATTHPRPGQSPH